MKNYTVTKQREETAVHEVPAASESESPSAGSFAKVAYEWNNALQLAARKLWGKETSFIPRS